MADCLCFWLAGATLFLDDIEAKNLPCTYPCRPDNMSNFRPLVQRYLDVMLGTDFLHLIPRSKFLFFSCFVIFSQTFRDSLYGFVKTSKWSLVPFTHNTPLWILVYIAFLDPKPLCSDFNCWLESTRTWKNNHARHSPGTWRTSRFIWRWKGRGPVLDIEGDWIPTS